MTQLKDSNKLSLVKARRSNRRPTARIKTGLASFIQTICTLTPMTDTGGTPTALYRKSRLFELALTGPKDYTFESYILFLANRLKTPVIRIPVPYGERLHGESHWQKGFQSELSLMVKIMAGICAWRTIAAAELKGKGS